MDEQRSSRSRGFLATEVLRGSARRVFGKLGAKLHGISDGGVRGDDRAGAQLCPGDKASLPFAHQVRDCLRMRH